jgi:uncharacterized membrane protein (UPF0127 family)
LLTKQDGSLVARCQRGISQSSLKAEDEMERRRYCVYNQTRECFLCLGVTPADTMFSRLRGLIGRLKMRLDEGMWMVPSRGIHTLGVFFPLDLIYLDENLRVIHLIEYFPRFRIAPLRTRAASVLELPTHTIYSSQTQPGDQLVICAVEEMENRLSRELPRVPAAIGDKPGVVAGNQ